jgi:cell division protein FtsN
MPARKRKQAIRGSNQRAAYPAWLWLLTGVLIGFLLSVAWILREGWPESQPRPDARAQAPAGSEAPLAELAGGKAEPAGKREFDFYSVLPEMEVVIPDAQIREQSDSPPPADSNARFLVQLGSFGNRADAEALKAQVALLGVQAQIQPVSINGADWFRVRVGPLASAREVEQVRAQLGQFASQAITLREKG